MTTCSCTTGLTVSIYKNRDQTISATISGPGDLTDSKIWFSVKSDRSDDDADAVITKLSANNGGATDQAAVTDGPGGVIEIYIDPVDTVSLNSKEYWFDIVIETSAGRKMQAVGSSILKILQPITVT